MVVEDNGAGVGPDHAAEIFRPFFTTKAHGDGIGLSLAHQAIASQGGALTLANDTDGGARFTITL
jgi:two-component system sensor histidine kinase HydH